MLETEIGQLKNQLAEEIAEKEMLKAKVDELNFKLEMMA